MKEFSNLEFRKIPSLQFLYEVNSYLVGDTTRWNDAKRAEEADRVKHC